MLLVLVLAFVEPAPPHVRGAAACFALAAAVAAMSCRALFVGG